jgi:hypothetical protein
MDFINRPAIFRPGGRILWENSQICSAGSKNPG